MYPDTHKIIGKHNPISSISKEELGDFNAKFKFGNVRNPWDWYVSLWTFGCQNMGGLKGRLTEEYALLSPMGIRQAARRFVGKSLQRKDPKIWQKLYSDPYKKENFHEWLKLILSEQGHEIGEAYKINPIASFCGLLSFRYLKLYTKHDGFKGIGNYEELKAFDQQANFMDLIIKNENLNEGMYEFAKRMNFSEQELSAILENFKERTNTSKRDRDYRNYYDQASIDLVGESDRLIIEKHGYGFE